MPLPCSPDSLPVAQLVPTPALTSDTPCEELSLRVQCRFPTAQEKAVVVKHLADKTTKDDKTKNVRMKSRLEASEDVVWALLDARSP